METDRETEKGGMEGWRYVDEGREGEGDGSETEGGGGLREGQKERETGERVEKTLIKRKTQE